MNEERRRQRGVAGELADSLQLGRPWQQHWRHWCLEKRGANRSSAAWLPSLPPFSLPPSLPLQPVPPLSSCAPPAFTLFIRLLRELNEAGRQTLTTESKHTAACTYLEPPPHLLFGFILKLTFNV